MRILILYVATDHNLALRMMQSLTGHDLEAQALEAAQKNGILALKTNVDLVVLLMSENSTENPDFAAMVQQIDYHDLPFITVRDGNIAPGEKINFFVQVGQWLDIDPSDPDRTFDQLAHAILNPDALPEADQSNNGVRWWAIPTALLVFLVAIAVALWMLNERGKGIEEATRLAERQREQAMLWPDEHPGWDLSLVGGQPRLSPQFTIASLRVPDSIAGHIIDGIFYNNEGTQLGVLDAKALSSTDNSFDIAVAAHDEEMIFCIIFDHAVSAKKRRRQLMIIAKSDEDWPTIMESRFATANDTCAEAANIRIDPELQAKVERQKQAKALYDSSNLASIWTVAADGIGIKIETLIHGGGHTTSATDMIIKSRSYAFIGIEWIELNSLLGERLANGGLERPTLFFYCVETFVPEENMYLADWAYIYNQATPIFTSLASPMEISRDPICNKLPNVDNIKRRPEPLTIEDKTVPAETTSSAIAGIKIGMPLSEARIKVSALMRTPTPDPTEDAFSDLLLAGREHLKRIKSTFSKGEVEFMSDRDAHIGIALLPDNTQTRVAGVYYTYRPTIFVSRAKPEALRAPEIRRALVAAVGQPTSDEGYGNWEDNSEEHELRWGETEPPYCPVPEPAPKAKPSYGLDYSSYSLAIDPDALPPVCAPHRGYSYKRFFDNESMVLWMVGNRE